MRQRIEFAYEIRQKLDAIRMEKDPRGSGSNKDRTERSSLVCCSSMGNTRNTRRDGATVNEGNAQDLSDPMADLINFSMELPSLIGHPDP